MMPCRTVRKPHPLVELKGISKHFGEGETRVDALRDITLTVSSGEVVGLLGPSGSGKSTLLNVIGAIIEPNEGWMRLDGEVVYDNRWLRRDLRRMRLEKIGFIFQIHNLLPFLDADRQCRRGVPSRRRAAATKPSSAPSSCSTTCRSGIASMPCRRSSPAARRSASPSPARSPTSRASSWRTSRPRPSIRRAPGIVMDLLRKLAREQQAAIIAVTHDEKIYRSVRPHLQVARRIAGRNGGANADSSIIPAQRLRFGLSSK